MEVFGDLQSTYELTRTYEGMTQTEKSVPLPMRMDAVLQKMVYESEFNMHWTSESEWARISNEAILHILRLESLLYQLLRSILEVLKNNYRTLQPTVNNTNRPTTSSCMNLPIPTSTLCMTLYPLHLYLHVCYNATMYLLLHGLLTMPISVSELT